MSKIRLTLKLMWPKNLKNIKITLDPDAYVAKKLEKKPAGQAMGKIKMCRGHLALLPANAAYRFRSVGEGVLLIQSMEGPESAAKWHEICQK